MLCDDFYICGAQTPERGGAERVVRAEPGRQTRGPGRAIKLTRLPGDWGGDGRGSGVNGHISESSRSSSVKKLTAAEILAPKGMSE